MEDDFFEWKSTALQSLSTYFKTPLKTLDLEKEHVPTFTHCFVDDSSYLNDGVISTSSGRKDSKNPYYCKVVKKDTLFEDAVDTTNSITLERQCYHIEIDISSTGQTYLTGDHVGVYPTNHVSQVERMLGLIGQSEDHWDSIIEFNGDVGFPACSLRVMFTHYLDILAVVKQDTFLILSKYSHDKRLLEIFGNRTLYTETIEKMNFNIMDCIEEYTINVKT